MSAPIEPKYFDTMRDMGRSIDRTINPDGVKRHGFALLMFDLNVSDGRINYISNANREDMLATMKEFIANCEGRVIEPPKGMQ
jgi:hypothetical protein